MGTEHQIQSELNVIARFGVCRNIFTYLMKIFEYSFSYQGLIIPERKNVYVGKVPSIKCPK